ncbi:GTP cyclohydrolase I FolE [Tepidicaulis sp. LMO-SS28]|uniref:GTP cyclohydrolase I FolE n=1 Tax=Tepidicaulis sp. LMO-SS28 TaxID=3447455 RepID=UPI003EE24568
MKQEVKLRDKVTEEVVFPPLQGRCGARRAVRELLQWIGENPDREGLVETPDRVLRAFEEYFGGYQIDPRQHLARTFSETASYSGMVVLSHIPFMSHCEHHMAPINGKAHVAYMPKEKVVGISKLARVVEAFARRLQIQERMTAEIGEVIQEVLQPLGVGVIVEGKHNCLCARGVGKQGAILTTSYFSGGFEEGELWRKQFETHINTAQNVAGSVGL